MAEQLRSHQLTAKYQELSEAAGLPTRRERMTVSGFRPVRAIDKNVSGLMSRQEGSGDWFGITPRTHTLETYDPEILARDTEGYLADRTIDSLMRHKLGQLIESAYHVSGLNTARATIEQLQGIKPGGTETIRYLLKNVSHFSAKPTEFIFGEKAKILYNELIPEVLGKRALFRRNST